MSYQIGDQVAYQGCEYRVSSVQFENETSVKWGFQNRGDAYNLYTIEHVDRKPHSVICLQKVLAWEFQLERTQQ